jgi:glycosyltransferase involved in cell wall biosynthesis
MLDSIHTFRWLQQFQSDQVDFLLFPSSPHRRIHSEIQSLVQSTTVATYKIQPGARWFAFPLWFADKLFGNFFRAAILRSAIRKFDPEFLHALELQNAGYLVLDSLPQKPSSNLKLIATNWGSDLYWFRRFPRHNVKLRKLLAASNFYSAECNRDVVLAKEMGFKGIVLPVIPNAGGLDSGLLNQTVSPLGERRIIAVKGYDGWVGRAKVALGALSLIAESLAGLDIVVYSANLKVARMARTVARKSGLDITVHKKGSLSHPQMLELFAMSKIYVGISESDGISTSLIEAMAMGAIPVQTATSCCDEWFKESGVSVTKISKGSVAEAIRSALELAQVQKNADINRQIVRERANSRDISIAAKTFYELH